MPARSSSAAVAYTSQDEIRRLIDLLQVLYGHKDRAFLTDLLAQIAHRVEWVIERDGWGAPPA